MGCLQKFELRTVNSTLLDMQVAQRLSSAEAKHFMMQRGINSFADAFCRLPHSLYIDSAMDLMHVEFLGNIMEHFSKMLWKMVRELKWVPSVKAFNSRITSFPHWGRGTRRKSYILPEDALSGPMENCTVGGCWTAHNIMLLVCYSIELMHIFVQDHDHPLWRCWCLHYKYIMQCLRPTFTPEDIRELDRTIYAQQQLLLQVYSSSIWHCKNHYSQHFPSNIAKWGPLRLSWCMMFEYMNQVVKFSGLRTNFLNTLQTTATRLAEKIAFNLYVRKHVHHLKPTLHVRDVLVQALHHSNHN